jgi:hypothetical protein
VRFELPGAVDPQLNAYIQKLKQLVEEAHPGINAKIQEQVPLDGQIQIMRLMSADIVNAFKAGYPVEDLAKSTVKNLESMLGVKEEIQREIGEEAKELHPYSKKVYELVHQDPRYISTDKVLPPSSMLHLDLALGYLTVHRFKMGDQPEAVAEDFCSELQRQVDKLEQDILMNMPIKGTH